MGVILVQDIIINLPIYIQLGKSPKSRFSLNLNTYRNAHFQTLNKAKVLFEERMLDLIRHLPLMSKVELTYTLFFGSKRAIDISNICCIVDKFFCDTLVNQKKLINDNMEVIARVTYQWGGVNTEAPRIEVTLANIETVEETKPMQIIFTAQELEDLIREAVLQQISLRDDQSFTINIAGDNSVTVIIGKIDGNTPVKATVTRTRKPRETVEEKQEESKPLFTPPAATAAMAAQEAEARESLVAHKIFATAENSTPPTAEAAPPVGKSLFSNLTKPVHDIPKE